MSTIQDLQQVQARKQEIQGGDASRVEKQKKSGKMTARERVSQLLDSQLSIYFMPSSMSKRASPSDSSSLL